MPQKIQLNINPANKLTKEQFTQQIANAIIATKTQQGNFSGTAADIAVTLLAEKYTKSFHVSLEEIYESVNNNVYLSVRDKALFQQAIYEYSCIVNLSSTTSKKLEKKRDLQSWLYARTICLIHKIEYLKHKEGAIIAAAQKITDQALAKELWLKGGKKRTEEEAERLRAELKQQDIKRTTKTIFGWICMW